MMAFRKRMKNWNEYIKDRFYNLNKERDLIKNKTLNKSGIYLWHNKITDKYFNYGNIVTVIRLYWK
jgi:hypothetical protein